MPKMLELKLVKPFLSIIILTKNEELHIGRAIDSVSPLKPLIYVVDSFSTDDTVKICKAAGANVIQREFVNHADQLNWALESIPIETEWVMRLDADELLTDELRDEIVAKLPALPLPICGVHLNRRHMFLNSWIRHGGRYPLTMLRIWRCGAAVAEARWMDEHMVLLKGQSVTFACDFVDHNLKGISDFIDKHNRYATREAIDVLSNRYQLNAPHGTLSFNTAPRQAVRKRMLKERVYNRMPIWFAPFAYFLYRYLFQLGICDGKAGLIYHFLQGWWYRFLVSAKVEEYNRVLRDLPDPPARLKELSRLTGVRI